MARHNPWTFKMIQQKTEVLSEWSQRSEIALKVHRLCN